MIEDPELEQIFVREAKARVQDLSQAVERPLAEAERDALFRHAHALKGLAGTLGHREVETLARGLVERVRDPLGRPLRLTHEGESAVRADVERLAAEVDRLAERRRPP